MDHFQTKGFIVLNGLPTKPNIELCLQVKTYAYKNLAVICIFNSFYNDYRIIIKTLKFNERILIEKGLHVYHGYPDFNHRATHFEKITHFERIFKVRLIRDHINALSF